MPAMRTGHVVPTIGAPAVRESPLQLGLEGHLVGMLAGPDVRTTVDPAPLAPPTVIILNAGVLHRIGPHRLHVNLARRLARCGVTSLRLDLSGVGDSRPVPGALSFRDSAVADTRLAMDHLAAETGARRFVLFGLCSGADNALATAVADERVVGLVVIDPPTYGTRRARARRLTARVRGLGGARAVATWGAGRIVHRVQTRLRALTSPDLAPATDPPVTGGREMPPPDAYRAQLTALVDRGVAILAVFSGALGERYNHAGQLFELFPELRGRIEPAYFPAANHTFTELAAQTALLELVTAWIDRRR